MSFLHAAFDKVCPSAEEASPRYVSLYEKSSSYGGPEEGGWWRHTVSLVKTQQFSSEAAAKKALAEIEALAAEWKQESVHAHGERCLRETEWCEARGLDADYLPEPDGPSKYMAVIEETSGSMESRGPSSYE